MVAYCFRPRFVAPILAGTKRQTIRAHRRRHARPGEEVQLYTGMRTRACRLIGRAVCAAVEPVWLAFSPRAAAELFRVGDTLLHPAAMERFAQADGFASVSDMAAFWFEHHAGPGDRLVEFEGVLIRWEPIKGEESAA